MPLAQKWALGLVALGALGLVLAAPKGVYAAGAAVRSVFAGSVSDIVKTAKAK